jgi:hypothetical protein
MSSHQETIKFLLGAAQRAEAAAGMQNAVAAEINGLNGMIQQAVSSTSISAGMDQSVASLTADSDRVAGHLMSLAQKLRDVAGQMGGLG